jgi:alkanesulfonate monooxygenase SsuD/methylene tetrahydromethanopterin reductase-like flavin-dependent oxidoreductase (luciferase family)
MARPAPTVPVPILIGGHKEWSLKTAARIGDGWCGVPTSIEDMGRIIGRLHELLEAEGRPVDGFMIQAGALDANTVEDYARLEEIGVTDCVVMPWMTALMDAGNDALEVPLSQRLELVHQFAEEVIEPLSRAGAAH